MGSRYVGVAIEPSMGDVQTINEYIDVVSESIAGEQNIIYIETAGLGRSIRQAVPGPWGESGSFDMICGPENMEYILQAALGKSHYDVNAATYYKHIWTPASEVPSLTMIISPDVKSQARRLTMTGISSMAFEAVAREVLTATVDVVAKTETLVAEGTPTFSTLRPFVFYDGVLSIDDGEIARCEAWRGTYENTIADDAYVLGSRFLPTLILGPCNFTGDMDIQFLDWSWYKRYLGGGTSPTTTIQSAALKLTFTGDATGGSGEWSNYKLEIDIPKVYLNTSTASFDRRERIVQSADWQAVYDTTSGYLCKFTIWNKRACTFASSKTLPSAFTIS